MDQVAPSPDLTPFLFLNLPVNIRQYIYKMLLCTFENPPENLKDNGCTLVPIRITKLQHDIYPQILRTCRKINHEATVIMRETNLFVMVTGVIRLDEPRKGFFSKYIPMIRIETEQQEKDFQKACVMTHEIYGSTKSPGILTDELYKFILLHGHLPLLCAALVVSVIETLPYCDKMLAVHIIIILETYEDISMLLSLFEKRQEKLIAPYRSEFKGFSGFQLKGNIADGSKDVVLLEIAQAPQLINPEGPIHGLQSMEAIGNEFFALGDVENANQIWCPALMTIRRILTLIQRRLLHETHDPEFIHQLMNT